MKPFSVRMWRAVAFIESGRDVSRQLDEAFENGDGDAMCAALWTLSKKRPRLALNIRKYILPPDQLSQVSKLMGLSMKDIRAAASKQREEFSIAY
jgi:hypothetical protein